MNDQNCATAPVEGVNPPDLYPHELTHNPSPPPPTLPPPPPPDRVIVDHVPEEIVPAARHKEVRACLLCGLKAKSRGLCADHYNNAYNAVRAGKTTWRKLFNKGKCLAKIGGSLAPSPYRFKRKSVKATTKKKTGPKPTVSAHSCKFPDCEKKANARGLCDVHYTHAYLMVKRKKTTWDKLEKAGKVNPKIEKPAKPTFKDWLLGK